jgi:hypothetical protein
VQVNIYKEKGSLISTMDEWKDLLGKEITLFYEDGDNHVSRKDGTLFLVTNTHMILMYGKVMLGISLNRIIRFEIKEVDDGEER